MTTPSIAGPVFLTVRGTYIPKTLEAARVLHNETAGSGPGMAAARANGDLSHKIYAPSLRSKQSSAKEGEVLFLDVWDDPQGLMSFFANPEVQKQGTRLFSSKEPTVWMPARGAFSYHLHAAAGKTERCVGMIRAPINSPEAAIEAFRAVDVKAQRDARRRGLLSHEVFIKLAAPGDTSPLELLGVDVWSDFQGMTEHYGEPQHMPKLDGILTGPPQLTVWEQAPGQWSEW